MEIFYKKNKDEEDEILYFRYSDADTIKYLEETDKDKSGKDQPFDLRIKAKIQYF